MSTDYFWHRDECAHCGRYDPALICVSFREFATLTHDAPDPPYGVVTEAGTWAEWKALLLSGGTIWDEYGEQIPAGAFVERVESSTVEERHKYAAAHAAAIGVVDYLDTHEPDGRPVCYTDPDGFRFSTRIC